MQKIITEDYTALSAETARRIAEYIRENPGALLCLAAGDTPLGAFAELIKMQNAGEVDLSGVYYAGLDEWVGLGYHDKGSCRQVMFDNFYTPAKIPRERIHVFDGLTDTAPECAAMNAWLRVHGGLGLALLGVGMNGHVGFNEPLNDDCPENLSDADGAIAVELDATTVSVSVKYFGATRPVKTGITLGLSVLRDARELLVIASGAQKAPIVKRAFYAAPSPTLPASALQNHPRLTLLLDAAAAG